MAQRKPKIEKKQMKLYFDEETISRIFEIEKHIRTNSSSEALRRAIDFFYDEKIAQKTKK